MKPDAIIKSLEFDTPDCGPYFVNLPDSGVLSRNPLKRLELLALIAARGTIPSHLIQELLVNGIQVLVYLDRVNGVRKIVSIHRVHGRERDVILTRPVFPSTESLLKN